MVIADATLKKGWGSNGLDTTDTTLFNQQCESVVDRLARNGANFVSSSIVDDVGGPVRMVGDRFHHRQPLGGDVNPEMTKSGSEISGHGSTLAKTLY